MIDKRAGLGAVLIAGTLAMAGCSSDDGGITLDGVRTAAVKAGASPTSCPIPFDVSAALPGNPGVQPGKVEAEVSKTTTPAPDPLAAQRDQGMAAIDAAAGVSINCEYQVNGKTVATWLFATPGRASINFMGPSIVHAAKMKVAQLEDFLKNAPAPGEVKLTPGGELAVARVHIQGDGDATLMVNPDGLVTADALTKTTETLLTQIHIN